MARPGGHVKIGVGGTVSVTVASLAVINGRPAIAFHDDTDDDLMFVRAARQQIVGFAPSHRHIWLYWLRAYTRGGEW